GPRCRFGKQPPPGVPMSSRGLGAPALLALLAAWLPLTEAKEPADERSAGASRAEELQKILGSLEKDNGATPSVLGDIDLDHAPAPVRRAAQVLKRTQVTLSLEKQSLESTMALFQKISGVTFVMSARARESVAREKPEVTLRLKELPLENVL